MGKSPAKCERVSTCVKLGLDYYRDFILEKAGTLTAMYSVEFPQLKVRLPNNFS